MNKLIYSAKYRLKMMRKMFFTSKKKWHNYMTAVYLTRTQSKSKHFSLKSRKY